jgi:hypothetical protein
MIICNNTEDFMSILGKALSEADGDTIMKLQDISAQWIQPESETESQQVLLTGALDAIGW